MTAGGTPSDAFEITIKIWHWDLGQLLFDKLTAEPNKPVKIETQDCQIEVTVAEVPMEGGA